MSAAHIGIGSTEARLRVWFWVFVACYCALGLATLTGDHRWGDDWAQYVLHARNLATGRPYADTGYIFNPDVAYLGPTNYPPGLPLLLAPVVALFGVNVVALKIVGLACMVLSLPVILRLAVPVTGTPVAMASVFLLALHPVYWNQRQFILSEAPYLLFSMLTLWWCARATEVQESRNAALVHGLILGILFFASVISRSIGIAILPALLVYGWAQRKPVGWFAGLVFSLSLLLWLQSTWLVAPPTYASELKVPTVGLVLAKPVGYLTALADMFPLPLGFSPVAATGVILASMAGAWFACTGAPPSARGLTAVREMAARVPFFIWYVASYLSALFVASVSADSRLLEPVLPILIVLAVYGVHEIAIKRARARLILIGAVLAAATYLLALDASGRFTPGIQMVNCTECVEMFGYIRDHSAPESVIVFSKPRAMALFGGRRSWIASGRYSRDELVQRMGRLHADFIVSGVPGGEFARRFPDGPAVRARIQEPDAQVVFRNSAFVVVRVGASRPGS